MSAKWIIIAAYDDGVYAVWDGGWSNRRLAKALRYDTEKDAMRAAVDHAIPSLESPVGLADPVIMFSHVMASSDGC